MEYGPPFSKLQDLLKSESMGLAGEELGFEVRKTSKQIAKLYVLILYLNCMKTKLPCWK